MINYIWHTTHYLFQTFVGFSCYSLHIRLFIAQKKLYLVFHNYFEFSNTFHHIQTRSVNNIHIFRAYTSYGKQDLHYRASCMWKELPANLKCS